MAVKKRMRILLIDVNCKYSSTGKIVYDLYENLRKQGHDAAICYGRGPLVKENKIFKFGLDWETNIHAALARITGFNGCFSYFSTKRLIQYMEWFRPDIVHIHELHAYFVNITPLINYIKKKKIKVVWTFHCEYMYTGKCGHAYECRGFETGCGCCPQVKEYPKSFFFDQTKRMFEQKRKLLRNLDMVIVTPSEWLAKRVKRSFLKDKPIYVIHNGIDTNIFRPTDSTDLKEELGISEKSKVVLSVAPDIMSKIKGGTWVKKLAHEMRDEDITFVMIGADRKKNADRIKCRR